MSSITDKYNLQSFTRKCMHQYLEHMDGHPARKLYDVFMDEVEIGVILEVLEFTGNNQSEASKILGITRTTLRNKIRKHNL